MGVIESDEHNVDTWIAGYNFMKADMEKAERVGANCVM